MPYDRKYRKSILSKKPHKASAKVSKENPDKRFRQSKPYGVKPHPFPRVLFSRAVFAESRKLSCSLGVAESHTYRANSIWDPDYTGGGRTVNGWAALNSLYQRYLVLGCKVYLSFNNPTIDGIRVGYRLRTADSQTALGQDMRQIIDLPMTYTSGLNNTGSQKKTFAFYIKPWSLLGIDKLEYMANSSQYSSLMGGNPQPLGFTAANGSGCTFDVFCIQPDQTLSNDIEYTMKMVFYVKCYNRISLGATGV